MAVLSAVKFVQGLNIGGIGEALFGTTAVLVVTSNGASNVGVARWKFEVLDVPPTSSVPTGVVQDGGISTYSFTPDLPGGYLVRLTTYAAGNVAQASDARCFGVPETSGRFVPPFTPRTELGDAVLNFGGQSRGWAKYLEDWLHYLDTLSPSPLAIDAKESVRFATTANIVLTGLQAVDGGAVTVAGNRVLVKNQALPEENGIYDAAVGAWTRSTDADTSPKVTSGLFCWVTEGTTQADSGWLLTTPDPIVLGVTGLTFVQFSGLGQVIAGDGLTKTVNTLDVVGHPDGSIVANPNNVQVGVLASDAQHGVRGGGTQHAIVIAAGAAGFMSGADKTKLDGLPSSAVASTRNLTAGAGMTGGGDLSADRTFDVVANADGSIAVNANDVQVGVLATDGQHGVRGGGTQHAVVISAGAAGFMSGADKTKLDGISAGAAGLTAAAPVNVTKSAAVVGLATDAARADHKHDITTAAATSVGATNAEGAATSLARSDHGHQVTDLVIAGQVAGNILYFNGANWSSAPATDASTPANVTKSAALAGVAATLARIDHKHDITTAVAVSVGSANSEGAASSLSRSDHVHDHGALAGGSLHALVISAGAAGFMSGADKTKLDLTGPLSAVPPVNVTKSAASAGIVGQVSRVDHKHDVTTAVPVTIDNSLAANAEGVATSLARSDHLHSHGALGGGTQHTEATIENAGFMSAIDKLKLDGLAEGAGLLQSAFVEVMANTTTVSVVFVAFDTITIALTKITAASALLIFFAVGASNSMNNQHVYFRVRVDGVVKRGIAVTSSGANGPESGAIILRVTGLASGAHTIDVQWRVDSGTGQCRPVAQPDSESASLLVEEVQS